MANKYLLLSFITIFLCSCTGSRYSSESILKDVDFDNISSVRILKYRTALFKESDTSFNEYVSKRIIENPILIEFNSRYSDTLKNSVKNFLNKFPESRSIPYTKNELIAFKKDYLIKNHNDTFDIDSLYNLPRRKWATRNILSFEYKITFYFELEDVKSLSVSKFEDNIIIYGFCCTDFENDWFYRTLKGYTAYSNEYILDIEFQKRYIELFNYILSYYNKTNGTDYPLLDVEYEIWNGIISDY